MKQPPTPAAPPLRRPAVIPFFSRLSLAALALFSAFSFWSSLLPSLAEASKPKCRLERLDPAFLKDEELRLYATVVELEGNILGDYGAGQFALQIDGKLVGKAKKAQPFSSAKEDVQVALVVEVAAQYKPALEQVKEALQDFLDDQPTSMKVTLIPFGSDIDKSPFMPAPAMSQKVAELTPEDDSVEVRLNDAVRLALTELKKLDPKEPGLVPPRRLIVVVSDGLNAKMDRPSFKKLGEDAAKAGVPIHSIAFSPIDERGPLLNLGEISKRSNGTFRWAQKPADLKTQLSTLADEVRKQYVLTFASPVTTTEHHTFGLRCEELRSNVLGGRGQFGYVVAANAGFFTRNPWVAYTVGGILGLLVLLWILGTVMSARANRPAAAPAAAKAQAPAPAATGRPKIGEVQAVGSKSGQGPQASKIEPVGTVGRAKIEPVGNVGRSAPVAAVGASQAAAAGGAVGAGTLIAIGGGLAGNRFQVRGTITLGKAAGNTITVTDDAAVSGRHAELSMVGGGVKVTDLGSTNGTFVNSAKVSGSHVARDGDIVRFGQTQFKIRID